MGEPMVSAPAMAMRPTTCIASDFSPHCVVSFSSGDCLDLRNVLMNDSWPRPDSSDFSTNATLALNRRFSRAWRAASFFFQGDNASGTCFKNEMILGRAPDGEMVCRRPKVVCRRICAGLAVPQDRRETVRE